MGSTHDILNPFSNHLFNSIPVSKIHIRRRKAGLLLRLADVTPLMYDSVHGRQKTPQMSWCYLSATSHGVTYHKTASSYSNPLSAYRAREVVFRLQFPDDEGGNYSRNQWRRNVPRQTTRRGRGVGQGRRKMYRILRCVVSSYRLDSLLLTEDCTVRDWGVSLISILKPRITESRGGGLVTYATLRNAS